MEKPKKIKRGSHEYKIVSPEEFIEMRDRLRADLKAFLTPHDPEQYRKQNTVLYMPDDKHSGFGINPNGQLLSVFSISHEHGRRGHEMVELAVRLGAHHLDCLGDYLMKLYSERGFQIHQINQWRDEHAPRGWNYEKFKRPSHYEMRLKK